jgi:hypothetical protein
VTARSAADVHGIQANTVALFYRKIRLVIAEKLGAEAVPFAGEIEVDESYFGGVRKGPRGRGAAGKVPVFGLLKRGGKVYALPTTDTGEKNSPADWFAPTAILPTACWMSRSFITCASTMRSTSPTGKTTATASRTSGTSQALAQPLQRHPA